MDCKNQYEERRSSPRCKARMIIIGHKEWIREQACNLSITGCGFYMPKDLQVGQKMKVLFWLDKVGSFVSVWIRIVNVDVDYAGASFINLPFHSERLIARWLDVNTVDTQAA